MDLAQNSTTAQRPQMPWPVGSGLSSPEMQGLPKAVFSVKRAVLGG